MYFVFQPQNHRERERVIERILIKRYSHEQIIF
jgi:hypothetical protein